jgi:Protein of unknown function (DUF5818)
MKRKRQTHSLRFLSVALLASGMVLLTGQLYGQQTAPPSQQQPQEKPDQSGQQAPDSQAQSQPGGVQVFTGVIVKSGDKYVLQDSTSNTTYDVDAQEQVKQFEGKKVRFHGTLDPGGKMIHVQ